MKFWMADSTDVYISNATRGGVFEFWSTMTNEQDEDMCVIWKHKIIHSSVTYHSLYADSYPNYVTY